MTENTAAVAKPAFKLNAWFALWLILGYVAAQFVGGILVGLVWGINVGFQAGLHGGHLPAHLHLGIDVRAWSAFVGMLLGTVTVIAVIWRYPREWLRDGEATGVAWRAPTRQEAYAVAVLLALLLVALVGTVEHYLPPDLRSLTGPMERLAASHGLPHVLFVILAVFLAPPTEELIFRGAAFAALARSFGTVAAVVVSTLAFVLLHAADKIHYWPGFVLVGFLALANVFLRLRYRSLWPGILLHMTYNGLLILLT